MVKYKFKKKVRLFNLIYCVYCVKFIMNSIYKYNIYNLYYNYLFEMFYNVSLIKSLFIYKFLFRNIDYIFYLMVIMYFFFVKFEGI